MKNDKLKKRHLLKTPGKCVFCKSPIPKRNLICKHNICKFFLLIIDCLEELEDGT